jgi:streptogramin lyase
MCGLFCVVAGGAAAQPVTEFPLPPGAGVNYPALAYASAMTAGPDGNVWLTDRARSSVIRMTPAGEATEFAVAGSGIAVGPDGGIWVAGYQEVTRLSPGDGSVTRFGFPGGPLAAGIVTGPDNNLWFTTVNLSYLSPNGLPWFAEVGRLTPGGVVTQYPLANGAGGATGLVVGPDRNIWFIGSPGPFGRISPLGTLSVIETQPSINALVASLALGPDGNVWCPLPATAFDDTVGFIARVTPTGEMTQFAVPTPHAYPFDIVAGPDGNLWFTEQNANKIGRITPQGVIAEFPVPTPNSQPAAICVGPDGNIWFTESNAAKVGRLVLSGSAAGKITLTVPAAASAHGVNGTFFHTDLWLMNRSFTSPVVATLTYRCTTGFACVNAVQAVVLQARQSVMLTDVIGRTFSAPGTSGAIEVSWPTTSGPVSASSQVTSPLPPTPAFGTLVPALPLSDAKMHAVFIGVQSGGGLTSGSRSNAGAYNPQPVPVDMTFALHRGDGTTLGTYSRTYQPNEASQLYPNVFDLLGAGSTTATDAYLVVTATAPVFPYVTVIDNVSGDSSFLAASDDETAP